MKIEIQGRDAVGATEELLTIEGIKEAIKPLKKSNGGASNHHCNNCSNCRRNVNHCRKALPVVSEVPKIPTVSNWFKD